MKNAFAMVVAFGSLLGNGCAINRTIVRDGQVSIASHSLPLERVVEKLSDTESSRVTFHVQGWFYQRNVPEADGNVVVDQDGELFVQTISHSSSPQYGPLEEIGNVFSDVRKPCMWNQYVTGISAMDLDQDGLHDLAVDVACVSQSGRTDTKTFYFARGNGKFEKGASGVRFSDPRENSSFPHQF